MSPAKQVAHPVQIVTVGKGERKFELDVDALSSILLRDSIRDTPVVVLSVAGDFRKGKSFLLNHFLRYLNAGQDPKVWSSTNNQPLSGFSWRGGCERDTTGILMWSEPFVLTTKAGPVAVVLMDTQGCFDNEYTVKDSATVFALSTMTSSIQVFNLKHNLQEDNLQVLEIFCEFGRLAMEEVHTKPFQRLIFLIRDWSYPYNHAYGFKGGASLLEAVLKVNDKMPEQLQRVRRRVNDCFQELECFLMPHPGKTVATSPVFDGRVKDYDEQFLKSLKDFVTDLLSPQRLVTKKIGGQQVTGRALLEYFKAYSEIFAGNTMPEPKTILEATAEANNLTAVADIQDMYQGKLETLCGSKQPYINPQLLVERNGAIEAECLQQFESIAKMGGEEFTTPYRERLLQSMGHMFSEYSALNSRKNIFSLVGVPLLLVVTGLVLVLAARILESLGLSSLANAVNTSGNCFMALVALYFIARYTGNFPGFVLGIERSAELGWRWVSFYTASNLLHSRTASVNGSSSQMELQQQQEPAASRTSALVRA